MRICALALLALVATWPIPVVGAEMLSEERYQAFVEELGFDPLTRGPLEVLSRLDQDRDGILQPAEVPAGVEGYVADVAGEANFDVTQPIRLRELAVARQQRGLNDRPPLMESRVVRFTALKQPHSVGPPPNPSQVFAANYLGMHDRDGNQLLDRHEAASLPQQGQGLDKNGDGQISVYEMSLHFDVLQTPPEQQSVATFSIHAERYQTLPGWFRERDTNQDGQVMMHEYASSWTSAMLARFEALDLNGDGVITPKECLSSTSGPQP